MNISDYNIVKYTFLFNLLVIIVFALIYANISPDNFKPLNPKKGLTYIDYFFYAITIQTGIGLPDITTISNLANILVSIQSLIFMGSAFILITFILRKKQ